ncbi:DMT family protein [Geothrix sp. 21YS21S-2]|uniref:DMT family protein n=1 Tax=Geothrix sp. 21YS21S-2 TaxID=3068893 RepID=UPI0027B93896|nr:DMT family protein [Geothrix sp. 21YS21S-2]
MTVRTWLPITLLVVSNVFMTFAWYGHLKSQRDAPLLVAILTSWGIAFFEYSLMVPANRIGYGRYSLPQLKVIQEVVTLCVFAVFAVFYMRERLTLNHVWAALCLVGAVFFTFRR